MFSHVQYCVSSSFAAAAASSFLRGFMVPEIRYLKSLEAIPQHVNHTMTPSRRTVSILSIPKQSRHLLPSSERSRASPMGCPPSRCSVTGFRVAPRQKRPAADTRSRLQTMGGLTLGGTIKIKRSKKKNENDPLSWRSRSFPGYRVNMRPGPCSSGAAPLAG